MTITESKMTGVRLAPHDSPIHSLLFGDGVIIYGQATIQEAQVIKDILQIFCEESGQTHNWNKSSIFLVLI